jgi:subtilisin family serine protease
VLSTVRGGYAVRSGTSVASAYVSGVCALLSAFAPDMTGSQVRSRVLMGTDALPNRNQGCAGTGRLNAYRALAPTAVVMADPVRRAVP